MGHSSLQRLVNRTAIPWARDEQPSSHGSIDGGKIRLRGEGDGEQAKSHWQDYKAVALSNGLCEAFFQDNEALQAWSRTQPLSQQFRVIGDGHDGVWNIACRFGGEQVEERLEVLDWFHLMENLHKVEMSRAEYQRLRRHLWRGGVEPVGARLKKLESHQAGCFRRYVEKHGHRIVNYEAYQREGLCLGSGEVESLVKQIGERVKITGARWKRENVAQILRLRTAYLNGSPTLSICA